MKLVGKDYIGGGPKWMGNKFWMNATQDPTMDEWMNEWNDPSEIIWYTWPQKPFHPNNFSQILIPNSSQKYFSHIN